MILLKEFRCKYCHKLFFKAIIFIAEIEIKCRNCKNFNVRSLSQIKPQFQSQKGNGLNLKSLEE